MSLPNDDEDAERRMRMELVRIDRSNWRNAAAVTVADEQMRFATPYQPVALVILSKAYLEVDGKRWEPFALVVDGEILGVVALVFADQACGIFHLAVDRSAQGRGHGTAAVQAIIEYALELRGCDSVTLTVHPDNTVAQHVYERVGFKPTGEHRHGEPFWEYKRPHPSDE